MSVYTHTHTHTHLYSRIGKDNCNACISIVTNNIYHPLFSPGTFVAPHIGTYFFVASTGAWSSNRVTTMALMVDQQQVDYARMQYSDNVQSGSVHAVVQLKTGQRVWVKTYNYTSALYSSSSF